MKKSKIIGILTALLGVAVSFSAAIALYTKDVADVGFGIGSATYTSSEGVVDYKINGSASPTVLPTYHKKDGENAGTKLDNVYRHVKYEFALGASYDSHLVAQRYVTGNLSVSLTGINAALQGKLSVSMYFEGYVANSLGQQFYGANLKTTVEEVEYPINNYALTGASLTVNSRDMAVAIDGTQKLVVYFMLDDSVDVLAMNEANSLWTLGVTWAKPSAEFVPAYVASTQTLWAEDDEFVMAPNINRTEKGFEWTAAIKGSDTLTRAKCCQGSKWENHDDHELLDGTVYDVYWSGSDSDAASFTARVAS